MIFESLKREILLAAIAALFFIGIAIAGSLAIEYDTNRPGMDFSDFDMSSPDPILCEQACNDHPSCQAWTYIKPGIQGDKARCWLKNGIPDASFDACCDSGVKEKKLVEVKPELNERFDSGIPLADVPLSIHRRAAQLLEEMRGSSMAPGWEKDVKLGDVVAPFYRPDIDGIAYYEFTVEPTGYILLSATESDFPVAQWSSTEASISAELREEAQRSGKSAARFYKLDTLAYAAEDSNGELVSQFGEIPPRVEGLDPAWLDPANVQASEVIVKAGKGESDDKVDESERTVTKTGPIEYPIQLSSWTSWAELKAEYSQIYSLLNDKLRMDAAKDWETENLAKESGEGLVPGQPYRVALLYPDAKYDISGEGANYINSNLIDRQGLPSVLEINAVGSPPEGEAEIDIAVDYGNMGQESLKLVVLDPNIVKKQQNEKATEESLKLEIKQAWSPWRAYWAGSHADQRNYGQFTYNGCPVGCGPVAWGMLLGWVDHQAWLNNRPWIPYWGLYRRNGGGCAEANADAPRDMDSGATNMITEINNAVGTFCSPWGGTTFAWNMANVRRYVGCRSNIGIGVYYWAWAVENARDRAVNQIQYLGTPVILGIGFYDHYPLGYGYQVRDRIVRYVDPIFGITLWTSREYQRQFYINNGHAGRGNGWIPASTFFAGYVIR